MKQNSNEQTKAEVVPEIGPTLFCDGYKPMETDALETFATLKAGLKK